MPYYRWSGVLLNTTVLSGYSFAHTIEQLDQLLMKRGIALIAYNVVRKWHIRGINAESIASFFEHLQILLSSGVHVWQALVVISEQTVDERLAAVVYKMSDMVNEGSSLHEALSYYPQLFNEQLVHIAHIGVQSGELAVALQALCVYLQQAQQFKKRLRQLLLLPLCTFTAFMIMLFFVLIVVLPRYVGLFVAMGKELPYVTALLLQLHNAFFSYYALGLIFTSITVVALIVRLQSMPTIRRTIDRWLLHLPFIGSFVQTMSAMYFFQSLSLLLQGKMLLVPALEIARQSINNRYIKAQLKEMIEEVGNGMPLSEAMQHQCRFFFTQDVVLLLALGEQTATITQMVQRIMVMYQTQVEHQLNRYLLLIQPILMLFLGILVAALISAVYIPLFDLANLV